METSKCYNDFGVIDNSLSDKLNVAPLFSEWIIDDVPSYSATVYQTGKVTDINGYPIEMANVYLANQSNIGTATNANGQFSLENVPANQRVIVSFIGYKTVEFTTNGQPVNIVLEEEFESLDEVVITAPKTLGELPTSTYAGYGWLLGAIIAGTLWLNYKKTKKGSTGLAAASKKNTVKVSI